MATMCHLLLKVEGVVFVQSPKMCCQVFFDLELALLKASLLAYINTVLVFWAVDNTVCLIENRGFLPGTHCSNLASLLCLTY